MKKNAFYDKKPSEDFRLFWENVLIQISDTSADYNTLIDIRDSLMYDSKKLDFIIPFLSENVTISDGLQVHTRFETLPEIAQFNLITIFCIIGFKIPQSLLINDTLKLLVQSYTEPPKMKVYLNASLSVKHEEPHQDEKTEEITEDTTGEPPPIELQPMTKEFFDELENLLVKYPNYQEGLINHYLKANEVRRFYDTCVLFFSSDRAHEAIISFVRYYVLPYIKSLKNLANRIIFTPLLSFAQNNPVIVVKELFCPLFFDEKSNVNQFQFMQRLFDNPNIKEVALNLLFEGRVPSLEGPLSDDAIKWLVSIIPKSPQFPQEVVENILLHIRSQMEYQKKDASKCFLLFIRSQNIEGSNRNIAEEMIESLPDIMKPKAYEMLESK